MLSDSVRNLEVVLSCREYPENCGRIVLLPNLGQTIVQIRGPTQLISSIIHFENINMFPAFSQSRFRLDGICLHHVTNAPQSGCEILDTL